MLRALIGLALVVPAPALAETVFDTHRELAMPAGKTVKLFRPIDRQACAAMTRHHQSGKTQFIANHRANEACAELAARDAARAARLAAR